MRKTRTHVISIVLVFLLAGGLLTTNFLLGLKPKLGLDLRGGLSVTLTAPRGTRPDVLEKTIQILRNRVDAAGVAEPEISREGSNNVLIQLPGADDRRRLLELIGRTAQLQFRQVKAVIPEGDPAFSTATVTAGDDPNAEATLEHAEESSLYQVGPAEVTGASVRRASAVVDPNSGEWRVDVSFDSEGTRQWEAFTGRLACLQGVERQIAIVLDGKVESSPQVAQEVQCNDGLRQTSITGNFSQEEAKDLALVLTTGALPVKLERSEVRTVSPTLGGDSLRAGMIGGLLGLVLVMLYVLVYYRTLGLQTWLGLVVFASVNYGLVVAFGAWIGWSLTLAGIAGLIVSVGIATDSYIVFFERVKEEMQQGRTLRTSIDRGFKHAWRTMIAANTVTILAAIVLYFLAVGPVRGFALAMGVATLIDLFITYVFTWPFAALLARSRFFAEGRIIGMRHALEGNPEEKKSLLNRIYRSDFHIDFIGLRRRWFLISAVLVLISVVSLIPGIRGLTYGIDFRGGTVLRSPRGPDVTVSEVRSAMTDVGITEPVVQVVREIGGRSEIHVQSEELDQEKLNNAVAALAKVNNVPETSVNSDAVGEKWGAQITAKALRALGIFLLLVILYLSWRLEPKMAFAGIAAVIHDLVMTAGIYALVGFEVTPATVIALLTILGFSLYDTVVVFDKIRENQALPANAKKTFSQIANDSTNHVLMRSVNTSLTVLLPVGSLLFVGSFLLGAETLQDLSLALFIGVAASTYSSIFFATPLLSLWKEKEPRYAGLKSRVADKPSKEAPVFSPKETAPVTAGAGSRTGASGVRTERTQRKKQSRSKRKKRKR